MAWEVEGTDEFAQWYRGLDERDQDLVDAVVERLAASGPTLGRPFVDTVEGSSIPNLKELRTRAATGGQLRVLFVFDPRRTAILLLGGNKAGQWRAWYERTIPMAEELYAIYLRELREEGLIE